MTQTGTLTLTIDDTSHMNDVTTSVDPVTNLVTTTTNQDNGSTNHAVTTLVPTFTAVHTETLGGTPTDAVSGGANATTQSTYQGHLQETVSWVGTDAQGVTHNNQQTIGISVTTTGTTTEQDTFAADGSSTSTATTQQSSQGTQTTTNTGMISSVDATTGLLNTTLLNEIFTISGTTTATIGNIQATDTNNTTTESSTKTDSGTLAQGWQIHDTTTQTDSSGHTVNTQATNDTNQNTLTLENGSLTSQGAPTPSPPGNQNPPAPGANTSGAGSSSSGGWSDWYPWNWNRQDAEAIGTALATNPIQNYQTNSRLDELAHKRNMDNIMDMVNGGNNNVDLAKARLTHFAPPTRAVDGLVEDAKTYGNAAWGAANIADRTVGTVLVVKGVVTGLGRAGLRFFLPRDTGGLKAGWSVASGTQPPQLNVLNPSYMPDGRRLLQNLTNQVNDELGSNLPLALKVLSDAEVAAAAGHAGIARAQYGNALERLVKARIEADPILDSLYMHVGGKNNPDFIGKGALAGMNFDITTPGQAMNHLTRLGYGVGLNIITYLRPTTFP